MRVGNIAMLMVTAAHAENRPLESPPAGSIVFTDSHSKQLLRYGLDGADAMPRVIAHDIATYGGLMPWKGMLLAAAKNHKIVQVDPWCNNSCASTFLVDVPKAIGVEKVGEAFT